jgi:hypothetical protein
MPLRRREPNSGSPTLLLHQTTEGEGETNKQHGKSRQLAGE